MKFDIKLTDNADKDLDHFKAYEQRYILQAIFKFLAVDANVVTRKRKQLRPNPLAPWELRIGDYRVFYEILEEQLVRVLAIGHKKYNQLYIQGKRIEI